MRVVVRPSAVGPEVSNNHEAAVFRVWFRSTEVFTLVHQHRQEHHQTQTTPSAQTARTQRNPIRRTMYHQSQRRVQTMHRSRFARMIMPTGISLVVVVPYMKVDSRFRHDGSRGIDVCWSGTVLRWERVRFVMKGTEGSRGRIWREGWRGWGGMGRVGHE